VKVKAEPAPSNIAFQFELRSEMDESSLKLLAYRCRKLAENADPFIKKRLLDMALQYDSRLDGPSRAVLSLQDPLAIMDVHLPTQQQSKDGA